jgi:hypothetical protein
MRARVGDAVKDKTGADSGSHRDVEKNSMVFACTKPGFAKTPRRASRPRPRIGANAAKPFRTGTPRQGTVLTAVDVALQIHQFADADAYSQSAPTGGHGLILQQGSEGECGRQGPLRHLDREAWESSDGRGHFRPE